MIKNCLLCKKEFKVFKSRIEINKGIYCSRFCSDKSSIKQLKTKTSRIKTDNYKLSDIAKEKIRFSKLGHKVSEITKKKLSITHKLIKNIPPINRMFGENNPHFGKLPWNYMKDRTKLKNYSIDRNNSEHVRLRKLVLKRDDYRCLDCGEIKKGQMEVNHVYSWKNYPRLRYDLNNLESLCKTCHRIKTNSQLRNDHLLIYV